MRFKLTLLLPCLLIAAASLHAAPTWRAQADSLIDRGEFARAEALFQHLPRAQRKAGARDIDSLRTIMGRIRADFTLTPAQGAALIRERMPQATDAQIAHWKAIKAIEAMTIDGQERWFRKAVRNLWLLAPEFAQTNRDDEAATCSKYHQYYLQAMQADPDAQGVRDWHHAVITFTLDVAPDAVPAGETLRCWMPFPFQNLRQRNLRLERSNRPVIMSQGSKHHTVYMEAVAQKGQPTHFEYTFSYDVAERHLCRQDLVAMAQPYHRSDSLYLRYTASEPPHIIVDQAMRHLADSLTAGATGPVDAAGRIYHWIARTFPWAGAREYSTLRCIPRYVIDHGHGDCGQVALLYITLCRAAGIPARWESGYMLHPGEVNFHDWAETYFECVGWVPTDPSFGRTVEGSTLHDYYATGIDVYRLATNQGTGDALSPAKRFLRSETVDFQPGEVEWRGGNLYYDKWRSHLEVVSMTPVKADGPASLQ